MPAPRGRADGATVLLCPSDPVRKAIVGGDVINLCRRLVVPGTPGRSGIYGYDPALVAGDNHTFWIIGINPELMIIVTAGRAFDRRPAFAGVDRSIHGRIHHVESVRVFRIDSNLFKVPAAVPDAFVAGDLCPRGAGIVRRKQATFLCIDDGIHTIAVHGSDGDPDVASTFNRNSFRNFFPGRASVERFENAGAGSIRRRVNKPWWTTNVPKRRVNDLRVGR